MISGAEMPPFYFMGPLQTFHNLVPIGHRLSRFGGTGHLPATPSSFEHLFPFNVNSCKSRHSKDDRREVRTNNNHTGQK